MAETGGLGDARRLVIKLGTALLMRDGPRVDREFIWGLARQLGELVRAGRQCVLVTSGAIGTGCAALGWRERPPELARLQAAAAVGQPRLVALYEEAFREEGLLAGQILLTRAGLRDREHYLHARNTFSELLAAGVVPVVNENDSVSVDEIRHGDNDVLSALVANLIEADLLVLLTGVDGLHDAAGALVREVAEVSDEVRGWASAEQGAFARGGMATKLEAARISTVSGVTAVIAAGREPNVLLRLLGPAGERPGTLFRPVPEKLAGKKRWIAFTRLPAGVLVVDAGARRALVERGKSLLAAGLCEVRGEFAAGETVALLDPDGREFARGLVNCSAAEARRVQGLRREAIAALGGADFGELVHRDNLVLLERAAESPPPA